MNTVCTLYTYYYIQLLFFSRHRAVQPRRRFYEFTGRRRSVETRKVRVQQAKPCGAATALFLRASLMTRLTRPPRIGTFIILLCIRT